MVEHDDRNSSEQEHHPCIQHESLHRDRLAFDDDFSTLIVRFFYGFFEEW